MAELTVFEPVREAHVNCAVHRGRMMPSWVEIAEIGDVPPGSGKAFETEGFSVAVFNVDGNICAISDTCPHAGGSLGMGKLNGKIVTCPVHGMKFDVTTGCFSGTTDFAVASYPVEVVDGKIMVAVSPATRGVSAASD